MDRSGAAAPEFVVGVATLAGGVYLVNATFDVPIAGALGSLASTAALLVFGRVRERRALPPNPPPWQAFRPYLVLIAALLAGRGLAEVVPASARALVTSPATALVVTCVLTPLLLDLRGHRARHAGEAALRRWYPVATSTVAFLLLGALLTATGMSAVLAGAAAGLGPGYALVVPWVGALGGFVTGSNAGANAMFATSQADAAHALGFATPEVIAVQNVSASLATMASIPRVALAANLAEHANEPAPTAVAHASSSPPQSTAVTEEPAPAVDHGRVLRTVAGVDVLVLLLLGLTTILASG